jgi:peptide/nickel transport system substrate-binding protein
MKSKAFWLFSVLVILAMLLSSCGTPTVTPGAGNQTSGQENNPVTPPTEEPKEASTSTSKVSPKFSNPDTLMVITGAGEPETLEPSWTYETAGSSIELNIYEGLTFFKRESVSEFIPALATEWTPQEGGQEMTFKIRQGVKFHKGGTLEPHDVAYTLQRSMLQGRLDGYQTILYEVFFGSEYAFSSVKQFAAALVGKDSFDALTAEDTKSVCEKIKSKILADDAAGTVTMKFNKPIPYIFSLLSQQFMGAILDQEWMIENGDWDNDCATWTKWADPAAEDSLLFDQANGTGPYVLDHWTPGEEIVLTAFPDYWRKEPMWEGGPSGVAKIPRIVVRNVDEWGTRLAMFEAGDADEIYVPPVYRPQMDTAMGILCGIDEASCKEVNPDGYVKGFRQLPLPFITPAHLNWNINIEGGNPFIGSGELDGNGIPPDFFSDIHVRKAFNYCFDFDAMIKEAMAGEGIQAQGPILKDMMGYLKDTPPAFSYNPDKCVEEFKLADVDKDGVPAGQDDDDVWTKGFYFQIAYNTGNDTRQLGSEILKAGIEAVNTKFNITVVGMPWAVLLESRRQGKLAAFVSGWVEDFHDPHNWVGPFLYSQGSFGRVINLPADLAARIDGLILDGAKETDPVKRTAIYEELQRIPMEEAINIWFYQGLDGVHYQKWINGYFFNPAYGNSEVAFFYGLTKVPPQ